jgi:hypothetical protein
MSARRVPIVVACAAAAVVAGCGTTARHELQRPQGAPLAATPVTSLGDSAAAAAARRESDRASLAGEPAQYVSIQPRLASDGELYAAVRNRAAVPATGVVFVVAVVDRAGAVKEGPYTIDLGRQILPPSEVVMVPTRLGPYQDRAVLTSVKFEVQSAQPLAR